MIGGWSVALIWQYQDGEPLSLGNRYYSGDITRLKTNISQGMNVDDPVFDTSGFYFHDEVVQVNGVVSPALQRGDTRKNLDRNLRTLPTRVRGVRGTPLDYWDMSIVKRVNFTRRVRAQFHVELYNASNFVWFTAPNLDPTVANFGKVTDQRNLPRHFQIGAKIAF